MKLPATLLLIATALSSILVAQEPIDFDRARQIFERSKRGETVTTEERAYVERAMAERRNRNPSANQEPWKGHLTPLTELGTDKYKDQTGGLYGGGKNEPPPAHLQAAMREVAKIQPLDAAGKPSSDGKIGLMSVGMSNTTQEFSMFVSQANRDSEKSRAVVLVDGAQGARTGERWADANSDVWPVVDQRLSAAGVTAAQIQVIWMKQAEGGPARLGEFPKHAQVLKDNLAKSLNNLKRKFPDLRVAYLSSRIYGGYATTPLNPEPYAFETAFAPRWLIEDQIAGKPELNYDAARGEVKSPLLLWGPYLWADGETPRKADGLTYRREDFGNDGTHPTNSGREKVAGLLTRFLTTDPTAKAWYTGKR